MIDNMADNKNLEKQYVIKFKKPSDDSWWFHIPKKRFKDNTEILNWLKDNTETVGVEFQIVSEIEEF